jgi:hypothetical protein
MNRELPAVLNSARECAMQMMANATYIKEHLHEVAQGALDMIADSLSATARTQQEVRVQMIHILEKLGDVAEDLKSAE